MSRIYSIRTKERIDQQSAIENDKLAAEGDYLGCLKIEDAKDMRALQTSLITQERLINELIDAFEAHYNAYLESVVNVLINLNVDPSVYDSYDPATNKLLISEEGHVWLSKTGKGDFEDE